MKNLISNGVMGGEFRGGWSPGLPVPSREMEMEFSGDHRWGVVGGSVGDTRGGISGCAGTGASRSSVAVKLSGIWAEMTEEGEGGGREETEVEQREGKEALLLSRDPEPPRRLQQTGDRTSRGSGRERFWEQPE